MENNGINNATGLSLAQASEQVNQSTGGDANAAQNAFGRIFFSLIQRMLNEANSNSNSGA